MEADRADQETAPVKHGFSSPTFAPYDERTLAGLAADAEDHGWDGFFVWDHLLWDPFGGGLADTTVSLTAIALATQRIRFGALVTPLARRRPWKFARECVSLDRLSGGRLVVGVGLGVDDDVEPVGEAGTPRERAARLDEGLDVAAGLWSGETFGYDGAHHRLRDARLLPTPVQQPRVPVWVGGWWPNRPPFRRAARWDGMVPLNGEQPAQPLPPERLRDAVEFVVRLRGGKPLEVVASLFGKEPQPFVDAGATWCLSGIDPWGHTLDDARAVLRGGPPR